MLKIKVCTVNFFWPNIKVTNINVFEWMKSKRRVIEIMLIFYKVNNINFGVFASDSEFFKFKVSNFKYTLRCSSSYLPFFSRQVHVVPFCIY